MYDSFARMFDPFSVRTPTPDPHCENYYSISPYAWCGNNFTQYIDPDGRDRTIYDERDDSHYSADGNSDLREIIIKGGKSQWTSEIEDWHFNGTFEMYQEIFSEFSGMSYIQAEYHWSTFYSKDFFAYWNARAKAERDKEVLFKLSVFAGAMSTIPVPIAGAGALKGISAGVKTPKVAIQVSGEGKINVTPQLIKVHGNSLQSTRPTWGYKLYSNDGTFLKNGITSKPIPEARYPRWYMLDKYMDKFPFSNRRDAWNWEYQQNLIQKGPLNKNMH